MKRLALFAAIWLVAGGALSAITIGDTEVAVGADVRSRYADYHGSLTATDGSDHTHYSDLDFGALEMRFRVWASGDITEAIGFAMRLMLIDGEIGTGEESGAFNAADESAGVEFAYVVWHNEWGDVYLGRIPAAMVGNDLIVDSWRYDGWSGAYEGVFVSFADFEGWDVDFFYIDDNTDADDSCSGEPSEDCGHGIGVVVGFGEMIGWDLHIGAAEFNDDMTDSGTEYTALFAGANVALSDVADLELSWIDGDAGNDAIGDQSDEDDSGNAFIVRLDYEVNDEVGIHAMYGTVEQGAVFDSGCSHDSKGGTCGGFGFQPRDLHHFEGSSGEGYIFPGHHDGDLWYVAISWGDHWTLGWISWDDDDAGDDMEIFELVHEVIL